MFFGPPSSQLINDFKNYLSDGIDLKQVTVQSTSFKADLKDVEDKLGQLVREVGKLQEQLTNISIHTNERLGSGQTTIHA